jgi:hypothetical protein
MKTRAIMSIQENADTLRCGQCGRANCRLYRPYGNFYRAEDNRCNRCLTATGRMGHVPMLPTGNPDAPAWGYTSAPDEAIAAWLALPEGDPDTVGWGPTSRMSDEWRGESPFSGSISPCV